MGETNESERNHLANVLPICFNSVLQYMHPGHGTHNFSIGLRCDMQVLDVHNK